eukprot:1590047-Heterocapsa_arctica.AAC.1
MSPRKQNRAMHTPRWNFLMYSASIFSAVLVKAIGIGEGFAFCMPNSSRMAVANLGLPRIHVPVDVLAR